MKNGIVLIFALMLFGCTSKPVFVQEHIFKKNSWQRFDFVIFNVSVQKGEILDFTLIVNHSPKFSLLSLPLNVTFYTPDGEERSRNYNLTIKDKQGYWISQKTDSIFQKKIRIAENLHFANNGNCKVRIEQKTSLYELPNIIDLTLIATQSSR